MSPVGVQNFGHEPQTKSKWFGSTQETITISGQGLTDMWFLNNKNKNVSEKNSTLIGQLR